MSLQRRATFYERAAKLTPYVAAPAGDATFLVQTSDQNVGKSLFLKQTRGEIGVLARAVALVAGTLGPEAIEGRHFIDVGANIGTTTVSALLGHPFERAVAFEPEPRNFLTLKLNLVLNGVEDRATAHGLALSNRSGTAELIVYPDQGGKHWLATDESKLAQRGDEAAVVEVRTATLDELAAEGAIDPDAAGLLWMDAQAHEGHILGGATCLVERGVPVVVEWDPPELAQRGDIGMLQAVVQEHYTHFIDLRASHDPHAPPFETRSTDELDDYAQRFLEPGGRRFTDLLMLRLDSGVVEGLDIRELLAHAGVLKRGPDRAKAALLEELASDMGEPGDGTERESDSESQPRKKKKEKDGRGRAASGPKRRKPDKERRSKKGDRQKRKP